MSEFNFPKVEKEIFDVDNENLQKLASLFPSAVKDGQLDIDALKEELGHFEEVGAEKYELTWAGKQKAKKEARTNLVGKTLKYVEGDGVDEDTTQNLYIEGDNLEVLKLLRKNYYGAVKMIYIDPPYNTGNDFVYNDNFSATQEETEIAQGERDEYGERLIKNFKDSARYHTNWLNMMHPRLQIAKGLLTEDGIIFISIDDNEADNLKKICNEIFGEENFIAQVTWEKMYTTKNDSSGLSLSHEYILIYSKNINNCSINLLPRTEEMDARYLNADNDPRGPWKPIPYYAQGESKNGRYPITSPNGTEYFPPPNSHWRRIQEDTLSLIRDNRLYFGKNGDSQPNLKRFLSEVQQGLKSKTLWFHKDSGSNDSAKRELKEIFTENYSIFDFPKPTTLIAKMITLSCDKTANDIILDFFSGSATTAHACMQLNAEDKGNRKFICVQLPESIDEKSEAFDAGHKTICEIGKERIRRAGKKIKKEIEQDNQQLKLGEEPKKVPDIGFKVFRVEDTTLNWEKMALQGKDLASDYLPNTTDKDKLDFTPGFNDFDVVYEIMLRQDGLPLTSRIETLTDIGSRTYHVADSYLISLEENITADMVDKLSKLEPLPFKFVFRDSAFNDDIALKDEAFRRLNALIDKNKGGRKQAYTVEFI